MPSSKVRQAQLGVSHLAGPTRVPNSPWSLLAHLRLDQDVARGAGEGHRACEFVACDMALPDDAAAPATNPPTTTQQETLNGPPFSGSTWPDISPSRSQCWRSSAAGGSIGLPRRRQRHSETLLTYERSATRGAASALDQLGPRATAAHLQTRLGALGVDGVSCHYTQAQFQERGEAPEHWQYRLELVARAVHAQDKPATVTAAQGHRDCHQTACTTSALGHACSPLPWPRGRIGIAAALQPVRQCAASSRRAEWVRGSTPTTPSPAPPGTRDHSAAALARHGRLPSLSAWVCAAGG